MDPAHSSLSAYYIDEQSESVLQDCRMFSYPQNAPGGWPANNEPVDNQQNNRAILSEDYREGKFVKLSSFMTIAQDTTGLGYLRATLAGLKSRDIIHISDKGKSRLHDRIMLVMEAFSDNLRCLELCQHQQTRADGAYHWNVREVPTNNSADQDGLPNTLDVQVQPHGPLASNITINTRDFWNVEKEVNVAILGQVEYRSMFRLLEKIVPDLKFSLYAAVERTAEQESTSRETRQPHRNSNRGSRGQEEIRRAPSRAKDQRSIARKFF